MTNTNAAVSENINQAPYFSSSLPLSDQAFETWRKFIYDKTGIYFQNNKKYLLESRLQKRVNFLKLDSHDEYLDLIKYNGKGAYELKYLFEAITINETYFFRNQPQFDALVSKVLPEILSGKSKFDKKIRIWSAASSSGEEAYSIAMVFQDLIKPKYPGFEMEIIGTDINQAVIERAKKGIYKEYSVRNTSAYYLKKYFRQNKAGFEIDPKIKSMVTFKELNLYNDLNMKNMMNFDVIFCANVLIYFDTKSKIKTAMHLYNALRKGGYLFIGNAETLHGISKTFNIVSFPKTIGYKKG